MDRAISVGGKTGGSIPNPERTVEAREEQSFGQFLYGRCVAQAILGMKKSHEAREPPIKNDAAREGQPSGIVMIFVYLIVYRLSEFLLSTGGESHNRKK